MNKELNIHEAKTHLSRYLSDLKEGERIVLCRRNRPVAEIRLLPTEPEGPRPIGLGKGSMKMAPNFADPLPDEMLALFEA